MNPLPTIEVLEKFNQAEFPGAFTAEAPDFRVAFHDASESYYGWFRGHRFVSDPDYVWLEIADGVWRSVSWGARRLMLFNGDVRQVVSYLYSANKSALKPITFATNKA